MGSWVRYHNLRSVAKLALSGPPGFCDWVCGEDETFRAEITQQQSKQGSLFMEATGASKA